MGVQELSAVEIARRWPLWVALSDTFLDTELKEEAYRRIAGLIVEAGFDKEEALAIYQEDVTPAFAINLLSSTGEWAGWSEEYVRERVIEARRSSMRGALLRFAFRRHLDEEWRQISRYF